MENVRYINRFWSLELTYPDFTYQPVVDCERWFQGTDKTWGDYAEPAFSALSELDSYIILKGIFTERAYENRTRRLLLKYFDECKILLSELDITEPMYDVMSEIVRDMYNHIYVALYIGEGVRGTFEANGFVWSPSYFPDGTQDTVMVAGKAEPVSEVQLLTNRAISVFLMSAIRYTKRGYGDLRMLRGMADYGRQKIVPLVQFGESRKMMVYRSGLQLGEKMCSMTCSEFDYKLLSVAETVFD